MPNGTLAATFLATPDKAIGKVIMLLIKDAIV